MSNSWIFKSIKLLPLVIIFVWLSDASIAADGKILIAQTKTRKIRAQGPKMAYISFIEAAKFGNKSKMSGYMTKSLLARNKSVGSQANNSMEVAKVTKTPTGATLTVIQRLSNSRPVKRDWRIGFVFMKIENGSWKVDGWTPAKVNPPSKEILSWCAEAAKAEFPKKALQGKIQGQKVFLKQGNYSTGLGDGCLSLYFTGSCSMSILLWADKKIPSNKSYAVSGSKNFKAPKIAMGFSPRKGRSSRRIYNGQDGYGMRLYFGKPKGSKLPVYMVLRLPDKKRSHVEGYFVAEIH